MNLILVKMFPDYGQLVRDLGVVKHDQRVFVNRVLNGRASYHDWRYARELVEADKLIRAVLPQTHQTKDGGKN